MKSILLKSLALIALSFGSSSCSTLTGMGQDLQRLGQSMQNVAQGSLWNTSAEPTYESVPQAPDYEPLH